MKFRLEYSPMIGSVPTSLPCGLRGGRSWIVSLRPVDYWMLGGGMMGASVGVRAVGRLELGEAGPPCLFGSLGLGECVSSGLVRSSDGGRERMW